MDRNIDETALGVEVFPSGQIAALRQGAEAVQLGTVDFVWSDMGTLGNWRPEHCFVSLPFLFSGNEHFAALFDDEGGEKVAESLRKNLDIQVLGYGNAGFSVNATRDPAELEPADLKGVRIRVPEVPVYISAFKSVVAHPTPLAWGEVYTAMQTGVIDAVENPTEGLVNGTLNEVAPLRPVRSLLISAIGFAIFVCQAMPLGFCCAERGLVMVRARREDGVKCVWLWKDLTRSWSARVRPGSLRASI